ncbi:hypothetical protein GIW81_00845 [Hyphomicrobium sp. xq]|uniref:Uncharacterized protein n=1 Tax=Hyphomicrobium album TaxID=2665159 RepID=A0A6I3KBS4_9HYPH|nr:hypothetical protein [Hyphomicrobium album]MTD92875.1 hypothetical protein [Hyphomicrobium album]
MNRDEKLGHLFDGLIDQVLERIRSGTASAADFQAARQLLKDCNFDINRDNPPEKVKELIGELPNLEDDDPSLPQRLPN